MKKTIYLCLLVLLAVSFGCEKESITPMENGLNAKNKYDSNQDNQRRSSRDLPEDGIGKRHIIGDTLTVYIDYNEGVNWLENNNTSLAGQGDFDAIENLISNYRADMLANFTIYSIQASSVNNCGYVDKWLVNVHEYRAHFPTPFYVPFNTTSTATRHKPKPEVHPEENNDGEVPDSIDFVSTSFPYNICF